MQDLHKNSTAPLGTALFLFDCAQKPYQLRICHPENTGGHVGGA
jgi:hypothetical protein